MLALSGVFNTIILDTTNYANQDYMRVNYTPIVVYSMLLVTGSQSKNVSCFCLDMAQLRSLIGQSLCNAIYWSNMGFCVYWCSRWNGHIEYIETTAYGVLTFTMPNSVSRKLLTRTPPKTSPPNQCEMPPRAGSQSEAFFTRTLDNGR
jgi:hypothetical protein